MNNIEQSTLTHKYSIFVRLVMNKIHKYSELLKTMQKNDFSRIGRATLHDESNGYFSFVVKIELNPTVEFKEVKKLAIKYLRSLGL